MISREELADIARRKKTNIYFEEKEYLQYIFLYGISSYADKFVFKGGTCLRICYGMERASEDLDFSSSLGLGGIRIAFETCLKGFEHLGIEHETPVEKSFEGNIRFEVRFMGPLYAGDRRTTNTLKIDFNQNKSGSVPKVAAKLFSDVFPFTLNVQGESEILAEKVRSLAMRKQPRDLYDVWMLIQTGVEVDKSMLMRKLKEERAELSGISLPSKGEYEGDLRGLLAHLPDYKHVKDAVTKFLSSL